MLLVIGNKRYSSWSLRPWVLMRHFNIQFDEKLIALDLAQTHQDILKFSPSAKVPVLIDEGVTVWESMAIMEYLNEKFPDRKMWPSDRFKRSHARSICNEMHGGFQAMRQAMSHDLHKKVTTADFDFNQARPDVERVKQIWTECLKASRGPFLYGDFTIADAMYAPVVNRFVSYGIELDPFLQGYIDRMRLLPAHAEWIEDAMKERLKMPRYD